MKRMRGYIAVVLAVGAASIATVAQAPEERETSAQAVAGMRKTEAKEMDQTYTKAAPTAQKLTDEALAKHPEILLIAIHAFCEAAGEIERDLPQRDKAQPDRNAFHPTDHPQAVSSARISPDRILAWARISPDRRFTVR